VALPFSTQLIHATSPTDGFAVTPSSAQAIVVDATFGPLLADEVNVATADHYPQRVYAQQGFAVGYYTCGYKALNDTQFNAADYDTYSTVCTKNGVVGKVALESTYLFTTSDAENYAYLHGPSHCAALTDPIAQTIADLPPYSCSRTIHPSFLACFATAAANTQLLFQVLVFLSALALSKLAARYPPKHSLRSEAAPHATP
jgi:hypothetical protein